MSRHTPAPWKHHSDGDQEVITGETTGWGHDHLAYVVTPRDSEEHAANLLLILAAPDLLGAAVSVLKAFAPRGVEGLNPTQSGAIGRLMNALHKAGLE